MTFDDIISQRELDVLRVSAISNHVSLLSTLVSPSMRSLFLLVKHTPTVPTVLHGISFYLQPTMYMYTAAACMCLYYPV